MEQALKLHKKEEQIKEELGDRAGLAASYNNQALILMAWGQLEEALNLQKKGEQIEKELEEQSGLAITWWNLGLIYGLMNNRDKKIELWRKSIKLRKAIGVPIGDDEKDLEEVIKEPEKGDKKAQS